MGEPSKELEPPKAMLKIIRFIDTYIGEWSGRVFMLLIFPLIGGLTYEVVVRYVFNAPTIWAYEFAYMVYGAHFMLGAAYCLLKKGHIRTDLLYDKYPVKWQGRVDAFLYLIFFFPGMIYFFMAGWEEALHALEIGEESEATPWRPSLVPFKMSIPFAAILLLIQGVSELLKSIYAGVKGRWI